MRIRSTKPEFWKSEQIESVMWEVVYDGPIPRSANDVAPTVSPHEYVYLLFGREDELVYVGRSFRPGDRFTKHRRKRWWADVEGVVIVRVEEPASPRYGWQRSGLNTARLEAFAIKELHPRANVAAPSKEAMR